MLFIAREESTGYVFDDHLEAASVLDAIELARNPSEDHIRFEIINEAGEVVGVWDGENAIVL